MMVCAIRFPCCLMCFVRMRYALPVQVSNDEGHEGCHLLYSELVAEGRHKLDAVCSHYRPAAHTQSQQHIAVHMAEQHQKF